MSTQTPNPPSNPIWLLRGPHTAPGWRSLEADSRAGNIEVLTFDRDAWALVRAAQGPTSYQGLTLEAPADGMYIATNGVPCYLAGGEIVRDAAAVLAALGEDGRAALAEAADADDALIRLRRAY
jgi:hypothetical protein